MDKNRLILSFRNAVLKIFFVIIGITILWCSYYFFRENIITKKLFLIDNSLSMSVADIPFKNNTLSRFDAAKSLVNAIISDDLQLAIATFSRDLTLDLPFTRDKIVFSNTLDSLQMVHLGGGSDIFRAIQTLKNIYSHDDFELFIFSDGEYFWSGSMNENFKNTTFVAVGSSVGGKIVQNYNSDGSVYYRQFRGQDVISRVDAEKAKNIAETLGARLVFIQNSNDITRFVSEFSSSKNSINHNHGSFLQSFLVFLWVCCLFLGASISVYIFKKS